MFFMGSLYLQQVLGYDALQIGLEFLPATVIMASCRSASRAGS